MKHQFSHNIAPHVEAELNLASHAEPDSPQQSFMHLENAHVLGQASTYWHVKVHIKMLYWAVRHRDYREFMGQLVRIVGAATKTAIGLVPTGNTGGTNISPFKRLELTPEHQAIINKAKGM